MAAPAFPLVDDRLLMLGAGTTVKAGPLLTRPAPVCKTSVPEAADCGTTATTELTSQEFTVSATPFKVTPPLPCVAPKPDPEILRAEPTAPLAGVTPITKGRTVKFTALLCMPET